MHVAVQTGFESYWYEMKVRLRLEQTGVQMYSDPNYRWWQCRLVEYGAREGASSNRFE